MSFPFKCFMAVIIAYKSKTFGNTADWANSGSLIFCTGGRHFFHSPVDLPRTATYFENTDTCKISSYVNYKGYSDYR